jgi:hypothetical protein
MAKLTILTPKAFRPLFQPDLRYLGAHGGRGSGKSHHFAERIVDRMIEDPTIRAVCIREVQKSLRESAYRLIGDKIGALGVADRFRVLHDRIETPQGGVVIFMGMQDHTAESIKSLEGFRIAWVEEAQTLSEKSLELLRPTIRAPGSQMYFSWNPRNRMDAVDKFLRGDDVPKGAAVVQVNYDSNPWFPKELEAERELDRRLRPDRYSHIWLGDYEPQAVGAIWNMRDINEGRETELPNDLSRILIAVDPAVSSEAHSDEHGIVAVASSQSGHGYMLEDGTTRGAPERWARRAIAMYDRYDADGIVIEKNQGGDMCRHVLNSVRPGINIIEVHATRGKHVRAEPISALYALGRIHHVGTFPQLESQMCQITASGYEGDGSPDRVDAMVWGFTELFPKLVNKSNEVYRQQAVADMDYNVMSYETNDYRGRQAVAIGD